MGDLIVAFSYLQGSYRGDRVCPALQRGGKRQQSQVSAREIPIGISRRSVERHSNRLQRGGAVSVAGGFHTLSRKGPQPPALILHLALLGAGGWTR